VQLLLRDILLVLFVNLVWIRQSSTTLIAGQCHRQWLGDGGRSALAHSAELRDESRRILRGREARSGGDWSCVERPEGRSGSTGTQHDCYIVVRSVQWIGIVYGTSQLAQGARDSQQLEWRDEP